jgi:hypothetical protein
VCGEAEKFFGFHWLPGACCAWWSMEGEKLVLTLQPKESCTMSTLNLAEIDSVESFNWFRMDSGKSILAITQKINEQETIKREFRFAPGQEIHVSFRMKERLSLLEVQYR